MAGILQAAVRSSGSDHLGADYINVLERGGPSGGRWFVRADVEACFAPEDRWEGSAESAALFDLLVDAGNS